MSRDHTGDLTYSENYNGPDPQLDAARSLAHDFGITPMSQTVSATLTLLARLLRPVAAVEVGTGTGTGTLALLRGMPNAGVLTSIDTNSTAQSSARDLIELARIRTGRLRLMTGRAEEVLLRLAPGAYDLVVIDCEPGKVEPLLTPALRLLDASGLLLVNQTLLHGAVADPVDRSPRARAMRSLLHTIAENPRLTRVLLPIGSGLLAVQKTGG